jgi:hypothetical protein
VEIGEEHTLDLRHSKENMLARVVDWVSALMAGEDFIFDWGGGYTFTWDLPNMTHRVVEGWHETYGATPEDSVIYPRVEGLSKWSKFRVKRIR